MDKKKIEVSEGNYLPRELNYTKTPEDGNIKTVNDTG